MQKIPKQKMAYLNIVKINFICLLFILPKSGLKHLATSRYMDYNIAAQHIPEPLTVKKNGIAAITIDY